MPNFEYSGRNENTGAAVSGVREAASHISLGQELLSEGILLTKFKQLKKSSRGDTVYKSIFRHVPIIERVLFARYFSLMLRAGLDVKQALTALREQSSNKAMKEGIQGVYQGVEKGATLADSMGNHPNVFSPFFISFVRVGETTGQLQESLDILAIQLQKEYDLRRAVRGGLLYPAVILVALIAVAFAMLVFVVPKLAEVFEGFDVELPLPTRVLLGIGSFFEVYWWLALIIMIALVAAGWGLFKVRSIKNSIMHGFLYMPIVGSIMKQVNLARFSRNLSSLLKSGVAFIEALRILGENTPHATYGKVYSAAQDHVKKGELLSSFLVVHKRLFPPLVINVIKVGEETGSIDQVLLEIALFYESEVDQVMKNLTSIMEPVLMVGIGLAVGALAISVISPIYNLVNVI